LCFAADISASWQHWLREGLARLSPSDAATAALDLSLLVGQELFSGKHVASDWVKVRGAADKIDVSELIP
jgi:hypothetical protein